jgi:hypothetical protein
MQRFHLGSDRAGRPQSGLGKDLLQIVVKGTNAHVHSIICQAEKLRARGVAARPSLSERTAPVRRGVWLRRTRTPGFMAA